MNEQRFPKGWDEQRVKQLIAEHATLLHGKVIIDPNTMMPLNFAIAPTPGASINSSSNPAYIGPSTTSNNISGGK